MSLFGHFVVSVQEKVPWVELCLILMQCPSDFRIKNGKTDTANCWFSIFLPIRMKCRSGYRIFTIFLICLDKIDVLSTVHMHFLYFLKNRRPSTFLLVVVKTEYLTLAGVKAERLSEGLSPRHCALSLVGEPIMYPEINSLVDELHRRRISTFLVTNAQFPDKIKLLKPITQVY